MQVFANKILILGTGGTIAGKAAGVLQAVGYEAGVIPVSELLAGLPTSSVFGQIDVQTQQLAQIDSKDMGLAVWLPTSTVRELTFSGRWPPAASRLSVR